MNLLFNLDLKLLIYRVTYHIDVQILVLARLALRDHWQDGLREFGQICVAYVLKDLELVAHVVASAFLDLIECYRKEELDAVGSLED